MAWRAANCLLKLQDAFNAAYPNRNKKIGPDAFIGDEAHQGRKSDHNPNPAGVVLAYDISNDPVHGCAVHKIADYMIAHPDTRVRYIISNRRITGNAAFVAGNPRYKCPAPWKWGVFDGENPHNKHIHVSAEKAAALYDDSRQWDIGPVLPSQVPPPGDTLTKMPDFLQRGSLGDDVKVLQWLMRVQVDGDFGINTEAAVQTWQQQNGLDGDGVVGHLTWGKIRELFPPPVVVPVPPPAFTVFNPQIDEARIGQIAASSPIATFGWPGRGKAPIGYTKGVACSFAKAVLSLRSNYGPANAMAHAATTMEHDALNVYRTQFAAFGMGNLVSGETTLRHLFVLLMGLGMRESSGKYTEGRDMSASNTSADSAEAGAWQQSWDSHGGIPQLQTMFEQFKPAGEILRNVYDEGVPTVISPDAGTGTGRDFQHLCKHSPHFAAMACGLGMRSLSNHLGPLTRHEAAIEPAADDMLKAVQASLG
jgi:peptidoglycan hydrolase-like protein with peptidoglycan-binding domain